MKSCNSYPFDWARSNRTHIIENEKSITHENKIILWGKPKLKTPISVLSYKWKYDCITQSFSSQAIHLSVQSLNDAHRLNRHNICLPPILQASYFLAQFLLGPLVATYVNSPHIRLTKLRSNCAISKEWIPSAWKRYPQWNIPATDSTLSHHLISNRSLTELTCMSYLWENIQLSEVQQWHTCISFIRVVLRKLMSFR